MWAPTIGTREEWGTDAGGASPIVAGRHATRQGTAAGALSAHVPSRRNGSRFAGTCAGAADWVCLAAAPTFAIMALLAAVAGGDGDVRICSTAPAAAPMSEMVLMYVLMSAFHSPPWLKLICGWRGDAHPCRSGFGDVKANQPSDPAAK